MTLASKDRGDDSFCPAVHRAEYRRKAEASRARRRKESRARVVAAGMTDKDIERLIEEARDEVSLRRLSA